MTSDDVDARAEQRRVVRRGYDAISHAYRSDDGRSNEGSSETTSTYETWLRELTDDLAPGSRILDLGCGAGVPADGWLVDAGFEVMGVDISEVQIGRARQLVPGATFVCADLADVELEPASFDAVISLYALIHVPLDDQRELFPRVRQWLRPGGHFLAIVGDERWTGTETYLGEPMFWDHADRATYLAWLEADGFEILWHRFVPEGASGHVLVRAKRPDADS